MVVYSVASGEREKKIKIKENKIRHDQRLKTPHHGMDGIVFI